MMKKELLERASFLHILCQDFEKAIPLQEKLCELNHNLYVLPFVKTAKDGKFLPHPLVGTTLYQLAKMQMNMPDSEEKAIPLM